MATTNPWKQFSSLLPKSSRVIGTVSSHNANGTSTLTLRNGSTFTAKGQEVPVNSKALVEGGVVVRQVPTLPLFTSGV
ncbi:hypothetical protein M3P05_01485 [Sansalvadorimonas sp. 2012CJ34-2]|uniref:Uncharacterized protein n=1 Tax=Parendozoicomonas callyspongiae TaxID=2942213 RepID=A0ABT0PB73_9GAMM|nr:hypothetical protein [Sansalvadorimonas sp. 2012CJ34-2]MCL6268625.1 hypothetical protein [Sansalvadorimonas sp. 2012CJ34-2]